MNLARPPVFRHVHLDECPSTQDLALQYAREAELVGLVTTDHQRAGRGRFDRTWQTSAGDSLTFSKIQWPYADFESIPLLGMAWAIAVAQAVNGQLQWPNDVVIGGKKVGGILTEIVKDPGGRRIPVVGIGVNIRQMAFPEEIAHRATSLRLAGRPDYEALELLEIILGFAGVISDPVSWRDIQGLWMERDATNGKRLRLPGGTEIVAQGIDENGNLIAEENGRVITTQVAEVTY